MNGTTSTGGLKSIEVTGRKDAAELRMRVMERRLLKLERIVERLQPQDGPDR